MASARAERGGVLAALIGAAVALASPGLAYGHVDAGASGSPALPAAPLGDHVVRHMPPGYDDAEYEHLIGVHAGAPLSRDSVRDSIIRLYATEKFSDIVVRETTLPDGGSPTVTFDLVPELRIQHMVFLGATTLSHDDLLRAALEGLTPTHGLSVTGGLPAPFFPEELEPMRRAIERAFERRGYASARITGHVAPLDAVNVDLQFDVDEGPATRITSLRVTGDPGLPFDTLMQGVALHVGDVLDREAVDRALDALRAQYQKGTFYRAKVGTPRVTRGRNSEQAELAIPVESGPAMTLGFEGNRTFLERDLRERLEFKTDETLDVDAENDLAAKLLRYYRLSGFFDAKVRVDELWSLDRRHLAVLFVIEEGLPLAVTQLHFTGQHHFSESFLVDRVHESLRAAVPSPPDIGWVALDEGESALPASDRTQHVGQYRVEPSTVFAEEPYQEAIARIRALYNADGYLDTAALAPVVEIDDRHRTASVTINLVEGPVTHIGQVTMVGVPDGPRRLAAQGTLLPGQAYSSLAEENTRVALEKALKHEGYLFAKVEVGQLQTTEDKTVEAIQFQAAPGFQIRVRRIIITGNERTREGIIDANIALKEGDIFDPDLLEKTQRNLLRLGIFSRVTVEPLNSAHPEPEMDLVVSVEERPRLELTHGPGLSLVDGPRYTVDLVLNNLGGQGFDLVTQGKLYYFNWSYPVVSHLDGLEPQPGFFGGFGGHVNVGLRSPSLFNSAVGGHVDLIAEREERPAYFFERLAALLGFDWRIAGPLTASLTFPAFEFDAIHLQEGLFQIFTAPSGVSTSDLQQLRLNQGQTNLITLTPALTLDLRDNATHPHKGFFASINSEFAHSLGGDYYSFYAKPTATLKGYIPIGSMTLGLTASAGRVLPLAGGSVTVAPKRFFLGGVSTLRGYAEDGLIPEDDRTALHGEVLNCRSAFIPVGCTDAAKVINNGDLWPSFGGQAFVLYKAELRFPLFGALEGGIFLDAGDLWDQPPAIDAQLFQFRTIRITPGIGVHFNTPVGPLSLDLGFNPNPDTLLNETFASIRYLQFSIGQF